MESWERLEKAVCVMTNGQITNGSGRFNTKGDIRVADLYIECKYRTVKTLASKGRVTLDWCKTAEQNSKSKGLVPVIAYQKGTDEESSLVSFFCREADAHLFEREDNSGVSCPEDWVPVSNSSVSWYCYTYKDQQQ